MFRSRPLPLFRDPQKIGSIRCRKNKPPMSERKTRQPQPSSNFATVHQGLPSSPISQQIGSFPPHIWALDHGASMSSALYALPRRMAVQLASYGQATRLFKSKSIGQTPNSQQWLIRAFSSLQSVHLGISSWETMSQDYLLRGHHVYGYVPMRLRPLAGRPPSTAQPCESELTCRHDATRSSLGVVALP